MLCPCVVAADGGGHPLETSCCQDSVDIVGRASVHRDDRDTGLGDFYGRSEACSTGPHHEHGRGELVSE
ncbi:hypothetical protein GCM10010254_62240 [Streptomyces chromofuscus]|nr:hypothetical protein GCM10010254_62240 [Streptomyces chromofuscus]